ncbi:MBL fold metallo-hydrolase [Hydrogenophaga soli]
MPQAALLPPGLTVFERGWLSANNVLLVDDEQAALVDTGYCTHAAQTLALVAHALGPRPLDRVLNTHLHSDHCGGNAALQARYPALDTAIPPGLADAVARWDDTVLGYHATGQAMVRYGFNRLLQPGQTERLGGRPWQVHAAPGHDPHAVLLFEPESRTLISGDALWANGFGVVFPELDGEHAFADVAATLDLIEHLAPAVVVPGHGPVFADVGAALATARERLDGFVRQPQRHLRHAAKVLLKYKLLEWGQVPLAELHRWAAQTPLLAGIHPQVEGAPALLAAWVDQLLAELARSGAARVDADSVTNL